jgi:putative SOS response-associated peptidase YedK
MCGRFAMDKETDELIREFVISEGFANIGSWRPAWNLAPTDPVPIVIESVKGDDGPVRRLELAQWWLTPTWSKVLKLKAPMFNARAETAASKASFKASVASKRAVIPATGYYEWRTDADGTKTPYFIQLPGEIIGMAALYSWWADPSKTNDDESRWHLTATILTSDAVDQLVGIHDRNPVPLPRDWWDHWLDPTIVGDQDLLDEAVRAALPLAETLEFHEVAPVKGDGPELIAPLN